MCHLEEGTTGVLVVMALPEVGSQVRSLLVNLSTVGVVAQVHRRLVGCSGVQGIGTMVFTCIMGVYKRAYLVLFAMVLCCAWFPCVTCLGPCRVGSDTSHTSCCNTVITWSHLQTLYTFIGHTFSHGTHYTVVTWQLYPAYYTVVTWQYSTLHITLSSHGHTCHNFTHFMATLSTMLHITMLSSGHTF